MPIGSRHWTEASPSISKIINKHWMIIRNSFEKVDDFKTPPLMSYRRSQNIRDRVVKTCVPSIKGQRFIGRARMGSFPCLNCINCSLMRKGEIFTHPMTKEQYKLKHYMTCNSDWVIYVMWCPCELLYVGETKCEFKTRIANHRYTIRKKRTDLPVPKHFCELGHSEKDIRFMLLEHIPLPPKGGDRLTILKKRELWWIYHLNTLKPNGLNIDFKVTANMI